MSHTAEELCYHYSQLSNFWAEVAYAEDFHKIRHGGENIEAKYDLTWASGCGAKLPVLVNGSNNYFRYSSRPISLAIPPPPDLARPLDLFVIIPEIARIMSGTLTISWQNCALSSIKNELSPEMATSLYFAEHSLRTLHNPVMMARAFDSHLSVLGYLLIAQGILSRLLGSVPTITPVIEVRRYTCDLAKRFSIKETWSAFFADKHLTKENIGPGNTGITRIYTNDNPVIRAKLVIIGDSHSYSSLAQLFSFVFQQVVFAWSTRHSQYKPAYDFVFKQSMDADFVIEEVAERFFLRNFSTEKAV